MDVTLLVVKWQVSLLHLDDMVVFFRSKAEHIDYVIHVLTILRDAGVTMELEKCNVFTEKIEYLSHVNRPGRLQIVPPRRIL